MTVSDENEIQSEDNLIEWKVNDVIRAASSGETAVQLGSHTMQVQLDFKMSRPLPIAEAAEMLAEAVADLGAKVEVTPGMVNDPADNELRPGYHILFTGEFGEFETAFINDTPTITQGEYDLTLLAARGAIAWLIKMSGGADGHE